MTIEERRPLVSIGSNIIAYSFYYSYILGWYNELSLTTAEEIAFWAKAILILVPVLIVFQIVITIIYNIINGIITGEMDKFLKDEFSRKIERTATRNFYGVFMIGFFSSLLILALGMSIFFAFNVLISTIMIAGFVLDLSQFYYLRKGL